MLFITIATNQNSNRCCFLEITVCFGQCKSQFRVENSGFSLKLIQTNLHWYWNCCRKNQRHLRTGSSR